MTDRQNRLARLWALSLTWTERALLASMPDADARLAVDRWRGRASSDAFRSAAIAACRAGARK